MVLPRSHTWMHLFPPDVTFAARNAPAWFHTPLQARNDAGGGGRQALVVWNHAGDHPPDVVPYHGIVSINSPPLCDRRLRDAGFGYVRRFAAVPNLREPRWFIPLGSAAIASAAFCLYTPLRLSAKLKLCAARAAIRAGTPIWYRDEICIAQRTAPPLEKTLQELLLDRPIRLALSCGTDGPEGRRKPAMAVLDPGGRQLAFAKLAGSPVARELLGHEARVLAALAARPVLRYLVPRLIFAGDVAGTYALVQTPLQGRRVGPEFTPAHQRFLQVLAHGPPRPAAAAGLVANVRRLAWALPSPRTDLLGVLDHVMPVLESLNVPVTITHTDFVPWNLRIRPDGQIAAFDWDTAELDGLPLYDEVRHVTFVGFCVRHWTPRHADERLCELATSAPLGLGPRHVRAIVTVYLIHAILRFLMQGHRAEHPVVTWHEDLLARFHGRCVPACADAAPAGGNLCAQVV